MTANLSKAAVVSSFYKLAVAGEPDSTLTSHSAVASFQLIRALETTLSLTLFPSRQINGTIHRVGYQKCVCECVCRGGKHSATQ